MTIRDAKEADIPAIAAIYGEAVRTGTASFEIDPPDVTEMTNRFRIITEAGHPYLVWCNAEGAILGYAYASAFRPRIAYAATVENSVYVDPAAQGQGIGKALILALVERCTKDGKTQMIAVIAGNDNAASIGLHTACGFRHAGRLEKVGHKFGQWLDVTLMQRPLA